MPPAQSDSFAHMKLRQVAQRITDLPRAVAFYESIIGEPPTAVFDGFGAFFDLDGVRLFLDGNAPECLIYLEVADVRETVAALEAKGVKVLNQPHVVFPDSTGLFGPAGHEWLAFVEDSEGNHLGLMSREVA